ncbi:MAG: S9 family peptidase, partial [Candidatus Eremiobacteraeota bacterium]|nr:S9 family peptidase [Candidatus Eremiobacteraeota bacterium]
MNRSVLRASAVVSVLAIAASLSSPPARAALPTLIPRSVLFGNPEKTSPAISPDATKLAYLAPYNGVLSIWVRTIGKNDDRVVATDPQRPLRNVAWQPDSKHVLYAQDKGGNENFHVFQTDVATKQTRDLTPFPNARADIAAIDPLHPNEMLVTSNKRDPKVFDVYRVDYRTGALTMAAQNPGSYSDWGADNAFVVRAAVQSNPDGSSELLVRNDENSAWRTLLKGTTEDNIGIVGFSPDNKALYVISSVDANTSRLVKYDV